MKNSSKKYNLGFTAYGLGAAHTHALAVVFHRTADWQTAKKEAIEGNVFQQVKATSISRLEREFRLRLETLTQNQLELLVEEPSISKIPISLLAVFKRYQLVRDFAEEILADKLQTMDLDIRPSDYTSFIESKEVSHPELLELSDTSSEKLRQVTLRILTEGELLSSSKPKRITPSFLPEPVISVIREEDPALLRPFLQS